MARFSVPQAKNMVTRCLRNIIDPVPTPKERKEVWEHFQNRCAYCGEPMDPAARIGHLDHVVPASQGGSNHVSNFVLSCPACNGDDKRELDWDKFLRSVAGDAYGERRAKIHAWLHHDPSARTMLTETELAVLERVTAEAKEAITKAADELRSLRG